MSACVPANRSFLTGSYLWLTRGKVCTLRTGLLVPGYLRSRRLWQLSLPRKSHYFFGNDPAQWYTNIPTYA